MPEPEPVEIQVETSVIVVSHNRCQELRRCLESLEQSEQRERIEILVVDNGSKDGSAQLETDFPNAQFIRLPRNFGLTKALNIGVRAAKGEFAFFLHDDTEVSRDTISRLAGELQSHAEAAAVCPFLVTAEGAPAPQLRALPSPARRDAPSLVAEPGAGPKAVEYPAGAALMVRKYFIQAMRNIDERYGQYGSDAEICRQIHHAGKEILLIPHTRVVHHGSGQPRNEMEAADRALGLARYIGKHYGLASGLKVRAGAVLSALAGLRLSRFINLISGQKIDGSQPGA